jgi:hypothetical protein
LIDTELRKRRARWFLDSVSWFDFEDVCQIIRAHIHQKWHLWDQRRALEPWVNKIISNQMKNILRNHYGNFVRPCVNCPFNQSGQQEQNQKDSLCGFTPSGLQCSECPLYAKWEKTKKAAYDIKMAITLEAENSQILKLTSETFDIDVAIGKLHTEMKKALPEKQFFIYDLLFIQNKDEEEVAKLLGYKSNERGRKAGYKQIKNLRKKFKTQAIKLLSNTDICH